RRETFVPSSGLSHAATYPVPSAGLPQRPLEGRAPLYWRYWRDTTKCLRFPRQSVRRRAGTLAHPGAASCIQLEGSQLRQQGQIAVLLDSYLRFQAPDQSPTQLSGIRENSCLARSSIDQESFASSSGMFHLGGNRYSSGDVLGRNFCLMR